MDKFVIQQNIERYRALLITLGDVAARSRIAGLLAEEEAKLVRLGWSSEQTETPLSTHCP